jgi:NAD(P)-dependent dehydrogenase (short-subunit alcohol dehydrogenase family)
MDLGLAGRVAIVGGASRGMGRAIAAALVRGDPKVAVTAQEAARTLLEAAGVELPKQSNPHPEERPRGASRRVDDISAAHPSRRRAARGSSG